MTQTDQQKWDSRYRDTDRPPQAAQVLTDNLHLLPATGTVLDLACGLGGNALVLAQHGLDVDAWDISPVAIDQLATQARGLSLHPKTVDIQATSLSGRYYDVIVVSYFLDRSLAPAIIEALRPGGLLFYQTFNQQQCGRGPSRSAWRLQDNELLHLFAPLLVRYYREDGLCADTGLGIADEARLVAQKPL